MAACVEILQLVEVLKYLLITNPPIDRAMQQAATAGGVQTQHLLAVITLSLVDIYFLDYKIRHK
jgi:hypothetical protein